MSSVNESVFDSSADFFHAVLEAQTGGEVDHRLYINQDQISSNEFWRTCDLVTKLEQEIGVNATQELIETLTEAE